MSSRRIFIRNISLSAFAGLLTSSSAKARTNLSDTFMVSDRLPHKTPGPISLSTWDHGLPANAKAIEILLNGGKAIDAAQQGVMVVESDFTNTGVGLGGSPDRDGHVTLDACLMDELGNAGSVMFLEGIENPIAVARMVMDKTVHVQLVGEGAQQFALENGFTLDKRGLSEVSEKAWKEWLEKNTYKPVDYNNHDTIGLVCMDAGGNLSGACTTSGLAWKIHGRVGDSPIIGAGLFVDNEVGAATATGIGETVIRICGSHTIVEAMRHGKSPQQACELAIERLIKKNKKYLDANEGFIAGFLALSKDGEVGAYSVRPGLEYALAVNGENKLYKGDSFYK